MMVDLKTIQKIEVHTLDTSCVSDKYLLCFEDRNFECNKLMAELMQVIKGSTSLSGVAIEFSTLIQSSYTEDDIQSIIKKYIEPILKPNTNQPKPFIFQIEIINVQIIAFFSNFLKVLFKPVIICTILVVVLCLEVLFFIDGIAIRLGDINIYIISGILTLYICSSLFHELGHASACKYFGVNHGGVGFGLYLNFPVFYTDVSQVWRLSRKRRIIVNFAGIYFQLIYLIPLMIIYFFTDNHIIKYFILTVNMNFMFTLNPFFKFDGYWVMTDLLGVPNLRTRAGELFSYIANKIRGKAIIKKPYLLTLSPVYKLFMVFYSIVINLFFIYYFFFVLPRFLKSFFQFAPTQVSEIISNISLGNLPGFSETITIGAQLLLFCFTLFFLYKMLYKYIRMIALYFKKT